jgi:hypothetical protein
MFERNLKDISITLLMSIVFYIGIEAPIANLMAVFWSKLGNMTTEQQVQYQFIEDQIEVESEN